MKRDLYGSAISAGIVTRKGDGSVHYDTNITVQTSYDSGVTPNGAHGRYARFTDTRNRTLVGDTGDYSLAIVRGEITTNNVPLYCAKPSAIVTENGVSMWEATAQPGMAFTWTGPAYVPTNAGSITAATEQLLCSWPTYGYIPFYTAVTAPSGGVVPRIAGYLNLGSVGTSSDVLLATAATRLTSLFTTALGAATLTVTASASTQLFSFQNTNTTSTVYLDFTLPAPNAEYDQGGVAVSKAGILQACKLLGFQPNSVLAIPPSSTVAAPRAYQMGLRTTLNLYTYKTIRWVPEDVASVFPTANDVTGGTTGTYFDCYSYQHFLNQCVNPAFQRCIYDEYDGSTAVNEQCITRQLRSFCRANCLALAQWNTGTTYSTGNSVIYFGRAYIAVTASYNVIPNGVNASVIWADCGQAINYTSTDQSGYLTGDLVTFVSGGAAYYSVASGTTTGPPTVGGGNGWGAATSLYPTLLVPNVPAVGSIAPSITFNSTTSLFTLNLDCYGSGGTLPQNVDDGYYGFIDDTLFAQSSPQQYSNAALNDTARDSWGLTGTQCVATPAYTVARRPNNVYDERLTVEADDYFHQLFGNWPCIRLIYTDPRTQLTTSYVRYVPQVSNAGLSVPQPLPTVSPTPVTNAYYPYGRVAGAQTYLYTFPQDYPSIGCMWNPVDTFVVVTGSVPIEDDQTNPPYILADNGAQFLQQSNAATLKILAEFICRPSGSGQYGQQYRTEVIYEPQVPVVMDMQPSKEFKQFDFGVFMRMKGSQLLRPLSISNGGAVNIRWVFGRK
jgi:hypothetical protein